MGGSKAGIAGEFVFSDGSVLESGKVGGGAFVEGREKEVECYFFLFYLTSL